MCCMYAHMAQHGEARHGTHALTHVCEQMTGPAQLEASLTRLAWAWGMESERLIGLRMNVTGESRTNRSTWDRPTVIGLASRPVWSTSGQDSSLDAQGPVLVLPYCFFRSRGCGHLARFDDAVIFHHEFETDWRPAFWHNFYDG